MRSRHTHAVISALVRRLYSLNRYPVQLERQHSLAQLVEGRSFYSISNGNPLALGQGDTFRSTIYGSARADRDLIEILQDS